MDKCLEWVEFTLRALEMVVTLLFKLEAHETSGVDGLFFELSGSSNI